MTPEEIIKELEEEVATEDYIGLWQVVNRAEELAQTSRSANVQALTLDLVRRMLSRGFRAGHIAGKGGEFESWADQNVETIILRIETEWKELGREPSIGDIVDFDRDETSQLMGKE